jgi:hypothetical protein
MRWATITATQTEEEWFDEYIRTALNSPAPPLPPTSQKIGNSNATWFLTEPGIAFIHTTGGSFTDRTLAEIVVREQLRDHGVRQAQYTFDWDHDDKALIKEATWDDVEAKAKRLVQSGNVQIQTNTQNSILGKVWGDNIDKYNGGEPYQVEISREDPNSGTITQWQCECPWDQYAWQRTRQWKKYEGRLCAHALAVCWAARSHPLDDAAQQPLFNAPAQPGGRPSPFQVGPTPPQGQQLQLPGMFPGEATGTPPGPSGPPPAAAPPGAPQPAGPEVLPQWPMDPSLQQQVNPASVPGLKQPSPTNPVQYPGGTFSAVLSDWEFDNGHGSAIINRVSAEALQNGDMVSTKHDDVGTWVGRSEEHGAGGAAKIPARSPGEVLGTDQTTGMINVLFMNKATGVNEHGPMQPWGITAWFLPSELDPRPDIPRPGPAVKRR